MMMARRVVDRGVCGRPGRWRSCSDSWGNVFYARVVAVKTGNVLSMLAHYYYGVGGWTDNIFIQ